MGRLNRMAYGAGVGVGMGLNRIPHGAGAGAGRGIGSIGSYSPFRRTAAIPKVAASTSHGAPIGFKRLNGPNVRQATTGAARAVSPIGFRRLNGPMMREARVAEGVKNYNLKKAEEMTKGLSRGKKLMIGGGIAAGAIVLGARRHARRNQNEYNGPSNGMYGR